MKNKVIVVVGPTAVGKTKLSIRLAKKYGIDVISGDSIAVYKRLNIGSAKPTIKEMDNVKHHLIDVLEPDEDYSVADFQKEARKIIDAKPLSLICGGTGLYIQATLFNYEFNSKKRDLSLVEKYKDYSNIELYNLLKSLDKNLDESKIHYNNRKRVLRALEVYEDLNTSIHSFNHKKEALYDYFIIYLDMDRQLLYDRINKRVDMMLEDGLLKEVEDLKNEGIYPKGIGYREWVDYFNGIIDYNAAVENIKKNSRHLAKRQATWFKNQMKSHFYNVDLNNIDNLYNEIENDIDRWLNL